VEGPRTVVAGARIAVNWTGPDNQYDRIGIVAVGTPERSRAGKFSAPTGGNHPLQLVAPEAPGNYEIRYVTGQNADTLARALLTITRAEATIEGPRAVEAGSYFKVEWRGPGNDYDHITVAPKDSPEDQWKATSFVGRRSPATLHAPLEAGDYELRYQTGQSQATPARDDLRVTPAQLEPGQIRVTASPQRLGAGGAGSAVELIVDASGSMLQRIGSERRIDIAKKTLKNLTSNVIPAGTPFALRVFGREASSCQTDLDIPLRPLDAAAAGAQIDTLNAQSNAKTPIAASLEKVAADLDSIKGERLVILVTDGEETCGGNPARAIDKLRKGGVNVRVNIVGFAVEDRKTAALFRQWSNAGGGSYFDARDAASLNEAFSLAVRPAFEVLDAKKKLVADGLLGGEPVSVLPGAYSVRLKGVGARLQAVTVRSKQTTAIEF
jgi:Mg-chelatase subunit ChlD